MTFLSYCKISDGKEFKRPVTKFVLLPNVADAEDLDLHS